MDDAFVRIKIVTMVTEKCKILIVVVAVTSLTKFHISFFLE